MLCIESVWNAEIVSFETDGNITTYTLKNAAYNRTINPGSYVTIGFVASGKAASLSEIAAKKVEKTAQKAEGALTFNVTSQWNGGFVGELIITNNSDAAITGWSIEGNFGCEITSLWNGAIVSAENGYYVIKNADYNATIASGASVVAGFTANGAPDAVADAISASFMK